MSVFSALLDLFYPPKCVFCNRVLHAGHTRLCAECEQDLPYTIQGGQKVGKLFSVCVSPLYYRDHVRDSLHRYKFKNAKGYSSAYGILVADCIRENLAGRYDLISWVPLSRERLKERGYDQAMLLAMAVALELDDVAVSTLEKVLNVEKQSLMGDEHSRAKNISGAYTASDSELIAGKRILLIDDIVTTGATLDECAKVLLAAGAAEVLCATVARTE